MPSYFDLEVSLLGIKPAIWRRMLMRPTASFAQLHETIQESFGWESYHMWEFRRDDSATEPIAGVSSEGGAGWGPPTPDAEAVELSDYFDAGSGAGECLYVYDFGDYWRHRVKLLGTVEDPEEFRRRLVAGERACPPEDCGGVDGYERMVRFLATGEDPWGEDGIELAEWLGDWDPETVDLEGIRQAWSA